MDPREEVIPMLGDRRPPVHLGCHDAHSGNCPCHIPIATADDAGYPVGDLPAWLAGLALAIADGDEPAADRAVRELHRIGRELLRH